MNDRALQAIGDGCTISVTRRKIVVVSHLLIINEWLG